MLRVFDSFRNGNRFRIVLKGSPRDGPRWVSEMCALGSLTSSQRRSKWWDNKSLLISHKPHLLLDQRAERLLDLLVLQRNRLLDELRGAILVSILTLYQHTIRCWGGRSIYLPSKIIFTLLGLLLRWERLESALLLVCDGWRIHTKRRNSLCKHVLSLLTVKRLSKSLQVGSAEPCLLRG